MTALHCTEDVYFLWILPVVFQVPELPAAPVKFSHINWARKQRNIYN